MSSKNCERMSSEKDDNNNEKLEGADIANVLSSDGPIVKCVLLRASPESSFEADKKPSAKVDNENSERPILSDLIDEIEIDTTPSKSMVAKTLGGSFTFLGQYEDEGIVLMVRDIPDDAVSFDKTELLREKLSNLKSLCKERNIDITGMLEKSDLVDALLKESQIPPRNPHLLQPPLNKSAVRGDILMLKVADTKEELDGENGQEDAEINVPTNDEFFLNYTKSQYIVFASRTDIVESEVQKNDEGEREEENNEESEEEEEDEGEPYELGRGEEIDEEDKSAMFNLVMNEVLRQYREEHGRGPYTHELLELRATIAKELDVEVSQIEIVDWNTKANENSKNSARRITFHTEDKVLEYHPDPDEYLRPEDQLAGAQYPDEDSDEEYEPPSKKVKTSQDEDAEKKPQAVQGNLI